MRKEVAGDLFSLDQITDKICMTDYIFSLTCKFHLLIGINLNIIMSPEGTSNEFCFHHNT